jgi:hypothetical protein
MPITPEPISPEQVALLNGLPFCCTRVTSTRRTPGILAASCASAFRIVLHNRLCAGAPKGSVQVKGEEQDQS